MPPKKAFNPKRACDICYAKKTVCSLPTPEGPCERCVYRSLECTFEREKPSRKRRIRSSSSLTSSASSEVQTLSQRVRHLENALAIAKTEHKPELPRHIIASPNEPRTPTSSAASFVLSGRDGMALSARSPYSLISSQAATNTCSPAAVTDSTGLDASCYQLGPNWFFNGIPIFSEEGIRWLSTRTDQNVKLAEFFIPVDDPSPLSLVQRVSYREICDLPEQDEARRILTGFFDSPFRLAFPILDEVLFETTMEIAYEPVESNAASATQLSAKACVLATLSITAWWSNASHDNTWEIDTEMCAAKAHLLLVNLTESISLNTLQVIVLLQLQCIFKGRWKGATFFNSIACHMVYSLRGHIYTSPKSNRAMTGSDRETNHTRTLFWLCYMLDKDISLRTGNPPLLTETYCDLTPPIGIQYNLPLTDRSPEHTSPASGTITSCFPGDTHLSHLKQKVCHQLFSAQSLRYNDDQLLLNIRQLDDEIECWRISLPSDVRPALSVSQNFLSDSVEGDIPFIVRRMSLQLEYHHLVTIVHTTIRRCSPNDANESEDLHAVVHSSFDLSLEASRSTLLCLKFLLGIIAERSFRFFTSYFMTAALAIFLDIVIHPLGPQAQIDLELLMSAANTIKSIPLLNLAQNDISHVKEESKFVMRLVWLGTCAITKADRERDLVNHMEV